MGANRTLGKFLDAWLAFVESQRSPTTVRGYRDKVRRWKTVLGTVRVSKLLISRCPTDLARPPAMTHRAPPDIDPATWQAVVLDLRDREPVTAMAVLLAGVTGARRGELCGMRWSDIDLQRGLLTVARSIRHGVDKTVLVVAPTKTGRDRRIALDVRTLDVLAAYREQAERWAEDACVELSPDGYILTLDPTGATPLKPDTITAGFTRAAKRVGAQLRFHDLRHMSASLLIGAGTDVRTVAGRLGHADATTTLRICAHSFEARDREAAEVLGGLLPA